MNEQNKRVLFKGSLSNQNSTLETLIKWVAISVLGLFILGEAESWRKASSDPKPSIVNGCVVPAYLMTDRLIPEPLPLDSMKDSPTYAEQISWDIGRIEQLESVLINMINDRRELSQRCR